jgi:hypothetical protein
VLAVIVAALAVLAVLAVVALLRRIESRMRSRALRTARDVPQLSE